MHIIIGSTNNDDDGDKNTRILPQRPRLLIWTTWRAKYCRNEIFCNENENHNYCTSFYTVSQKKTSKIIFVITTSNFHQIW